MFQGHKVTAASFRTPGPLEPASYARPRSGLLLFASTGAAATGDTCTPPEPSFCPAPLGPGSGLPYPSAAQEGQT